MEEGVPPLGDSRDDPPLPPPSPPSSLSLSLSSSRPSALQQLPPSRPLPSETYIVQVPRDQIYRVPPPENAAIIAQSLRGNIEEKKKRCCRPSCLCIAITLVTLAIIIGIIVGVVHVFKIYPKSPQFSITKVIVKNASPHDKSHSMMSYEISLKADNLNGRMDVSYESGDAKLLFKEHNIGGGKVSSFTQEAKGSKTIDITLNGSETGLPREVAESIDDTKSDKPLSLNLAINAQINVKMSYIKSHKEVNVNCDLVVSTLAKSPMILSQECRTKT